MAYYMEEIEKLKYMRDRIAQSLVFQGMLPDRSIIDKRLESINARLALFQHTPVIEGNKFDVRTFNQEFMAAYEDLLIIYRLVYEFETKKLEETRAFAEMHLSDLEALASRYEEKTRLETASTAIGDTVFFKSNGFDIVTMNCVTTVNLGTIKVGQGSKVFFFLSGSGFQEENAVFILDENECQAYGVNGDYLVIPGEAKHKEYACSIPEDINQISTILLNAQGLVPRMKNTYVIYAGKNMVSIKEKYSTKYMEKIGSSPITIDTNESGRASFYVVNGSYINFEFSKATKSQNFSGYAIDGLQQKQKITFEYEAPFSFNYTTDGQVYAIRDYGIVKSDNLFFPHTGFYDFLIEEYTEENRIDLPLSLRIEQESELTPMLSMVAVRELKAISEEEIL